MEKMRDTIRAWGRIDEAHLESNSSDPNLDPCRSRIASALHLWVWVCPAWGSIPCGYAQGQFVCLHRQAFIHKVERGEGGSKGGRERGILHSGPCPNAQEFPLFSEAATLTSAAAQCGQPPPRTRRLAYSDCTCFVSNLVSATWLVEQHQLTSPALRSQRVYYCLHSG